MEESATLLLLVIADTEQVWDLLMPIHTWHACCEQNILLLHSTGYMNYPLQIYTGGAGEGGGFLKAMQLL